ncbi:MAG: FIST N-terminal domain-containing protein [Phycisphaerales bacterium]
MRKHASNPASTPAAATDRRLAVAAGLSSRSGAAMAAGEVSEQCLRALRQAGAGKAGADLVIAFYTPHHLERLAELRLTLHRELSPRCVIGVSAEGVIAGSVEQEKGPGLALFAASLPGVELTPFSTTDLPLIFGGGDSDDAPTHDDEGDLAHMAAAVGMRPGHRATFIFADPFSVNGDALLPALARARAMCDAGGAGAAQHDGGGIAHGRRGIVMGGLASASPRPRGNGLICQDRVLRDGLVGVSLGGAVRVDPVVSQGCRGFGPTVVATSTKGNIIRTLAGRPALDVLQEAIESLGEDERQLLSKGVFVGRVVNEYKERFGRDDFLIRNVVGVSKEEKAIAVAERVGVGQTIRFHMRDARTAAEDLGMLMDGQRLHSPPAGALLVSCNGRGSRLFEPPLGPNHDARAVARMLLGEPHEAGERVSKGGKDVDPPAKGQPMPPLAGFFAAGEIGPVGDGVFLHGHTVCAAVLRADSRSA